MHALTKDQLKKIEDSLDYVKKRPSFGRLASFSSYKSILANTGRFCSSGLFRTFNGTFFP